MLLKDFPIFNVKGYIFTGFFLFIYLFYLFIYFFYYLYSEHISLLVSAFTLYGNYFLHFVSSTLLIYVHVPPSVLTHVLHIIPPVQLFIPLMHVCSPLPEVDDSVCYQSSILTWL